MTVIIIIIIVFALHVIYAVDAGIIALVMADLLLRLRCVGEEDAKMQRREERAGEERLCVIVRV